MPEDPAAPGGAAADTRECPFCSEQIKATARKCRWCGEWLPQEGDAVAPPAAPPVAASAPAPVPAAALPPASLGSGQVVDLLSHLVDKNLAVFEEGEQGRARYRLLETVRQHAREKLEQSGQAEAIRDRHRDFFLRLVERAKSDWLEAEHDNMRAALNWFRERPGASPTAVPLEGRLGNLIEFWWSGGYVREGWEQLSWMLEASEGALPAVRARVLLGAGDLATFRGDYDAAQGYFGQALAVWREIGDKRQIAYALVRLGHIADWRGDNAAAHDRSLESLALSRELGESGALAIFHLGIAAYKMGDFHAARRWFSERRAALPEDGWAHVGLGNAARGLGEYREARAHYREALRRFAPAGARLGMAFALELDSAAEIALGRHEGAARRIGACVAWRETAGMPPPASDATLYRRLEEEMRAALGEEAYARLNAEGRAMTLEQAAAQALEEMPEAAEEMPEAAGGAEPPHVAPPRPSP